jgi:NAD(P)-dependent dehydrogenase (short-subunit alcohol dehydrogenase family)
MSLRGKVALVAGGTRGAGRGIAVELGAAGATVYVTGRTTRNEQSEYRRPETIEQTAELVSASGGNGIPVKVDHLIAEEVARLVDRIRAEQGRLDILVNDTWGGENLKEWNKAVWQHDLQNGLRLLTLGVHTHLITAHFALPLLIERPGGLLVEVTDGTAEYNADHYRINPFYDLAKVAVTRMAWAHAKDLEPHGATSVSISPGWLRSEMMLDAFGVTENNWRDATANVPHFAISETPRFVGRAVSDTRGRFRSCALERTIAFQRRAGEGLRLYRSRRFPSRRLAVRPGSHGCGQAGGRDRLSIARQLSRWELARRADILLQSSGHTPSGSHRQSRFLQ